MARISIKNIDFNDYSYLYHGVAFTGVAYENDSKGVLISEMSFVDGIQEGVSRSWYSSGAKKSEENFRYNGLNGLGQEWFENGKLKKRTVHELGILIESHEWDEDGHVISKYQLTEADPQFRMLKSLRLAKWQE